MLSLKQIIYIRELVAGESVCGLTREVVYPLDLIEIEKSVYRVNFMQKLKDDTYKFSAILPKLMVCTSKYSELLK